MNESKEMYLETILMLTNKIGKVKSIDIVREMNFSKPTVSVAMKKLKNENYINIDEQGYITLTSSGKKIAEMICERHEVLTNLLIKIGVSHDIAEQDACKIEHNLSEESFAKIKEYFNIK